MLARAAAQFGHLSDNPGAEAASLFCGVLGVDRSFLIAYPDHHPTESQKTQLEQAVRRRASGEPLAYVLGWREFYGRRFAVSPAVLIPRPETEELIDLVLAKVSAESARVLDLGCGSGCIAVTLAAERPAWQIDASDNSAAALEVARQNGRDPALAPGRVRFFESDWFANLQPHPYSAIVCNPPYVHRDERHLLGPGVGGFEPHAALFHPDPPALYEQILAQALAGSYLSPAPSGEGGVFFETSPRFAQSIADIARYLGLGCEVFPDLSRRERFVHAWLA